ncbi:hypothetical protein [Microbacterium sp.]|uniref:hypothetical protein n=1 Tax=Microbacterium sp. TaxID=51671 RepID=UPI0033415BF8
MTDSTFTQQRADEIVAAVNRNDVAGFTAGVAFAPGIVPTASAVADIAFPAGFRIDASSFSGDTISGHVSASAEGQNVSLAVIKQGGVWKLDSTGSAANITEARANG